MKNQIILIGMLTIVSVLFACQETTNNHSKTKNNAVVEDTSATTSDKSTSLQEQLNVKKSAFEQKASEEKKQIYAEGIQAVAESGILETAIQKGDQAPNFTLTNAKGDAIELKNILENGPVVLTWYRGGWCPYCNITLRSLQQALPQIKASGATLIALTPELPDSSLSTSEKNELDFEVLSDIGNQVAQQYGIVFTLTDAVAEKYQAAFGLHSYNGDESNQLPLAATYIIDSKGIVQYSFLHPDYRNRAEPEVILNELNKLK